MNLYKCTKCKNLLPLTEEYFYACHIKKYNKPGITSAGQCKSCAKEYQLNYQKSLKEKRLTRKNKPPQYREHGLLYIIGTTPDNPVKIGITTGNTIDKRIVSLQTSHWLDLKVLYLSPTIQYVSKLERKLHREYSEYRVRGEWYALPDKKLKNLIGHLQKNFEILVTGPRK